MKFTLLGDFTVTESDDDVTPRPAKLRTLLALLAVRHGETLTREAIVDELWGSTPPRNSLGTIQTYVYDIRKAFDAIDAGLGARTLLTRPQGYSLASVGLEYDIDRFDELVDLGRSLLGHGSTGASKEHLNRARDCLGEALSLWRGEPLANVARGDLLDSHVTWLFERKRHILSTRQQIDMALGRESELIGELMVLTELYPFHEGFCETLMLALARTGRRSEALEVFQRLRQRLSEELGLEPGPSTQRLQRALLDGDFEFTARASETELHRMPL